MTTIRASGEAAIGAPAERIYAILADYRQHHPRILPDAFFDFAVEQGGVGAGTVIRFRVKTGGGTLSFHQRVDEPEPGRVLRETDLDSGAVTTFTVTPEGDASHLRIDTVYQRGGIQGMIERIFAPPALGRLYADELARIDDYAREQVASATA